MLLTTVEIAARNQHFYQAISLSPIYIFEAVIIMLVAKILIKKMNWWGVIGLSVLLGYASGMKSLNAGYLGAFIVIFISIFLGSFLGWWLGKKLNKIKPKK